MGKNTGGGILGGVANLASRGDMLFWSKVGRFGGNVDKGEYKALYFSVIMLYFLACKTTYSQMQEYYINAVLISFLLYIR